MMKYIPYDKGTHFVYNQAVAVVAYLLLLAFNIPNAIIISIAFGLAVGVSVELYQLKTGKGVCELKDFLWGGMGVLMAFVPVLAQRFLV